MSSMVKNFLRILLPLIVLALGVMVTRKMVSMRKAPDRAPAQVRTTPVEVLRVSKGTESVMVRASGTVIPSREVMLRPQVSGRVAAMNPALQPGARFSQGEELLRIEATDYELAVAKARANMEQARFEVIQEKGRQAIAKKEWALLGRETSVSEEGRDLALRKPHLERAISAFQAAESGLKEAELALSRTVIRAPFNAQVRTENVELGQLLTSQNVIAHLTGTDQYWIQAALPVDDLSLVQFPKREDKLGAEVTVLHKSGKTQILRKGRVVRLLGDLEEAGRMARVLVAVDQPLSEGGLPLLLGSYVQVAFEGTLVADLCSIPPQALREGNRAWVMDAENKLEIRPVTVYRLEQDRALISDGLAMGDRVVVTRIGTPVPGMLLDEISGSQRDGRGSDNPTSGEEEADE